MGHKQGDQGECPIVAVKAVGRFDMVFESSVESFDELFVRSVGFGLRVEILESYNLVVLEGWIVGSLGVEKVDACGIGGVSIGDQDNGLVRICGANGLFHCNDSREGFPGVGQVVGGDFESLGRDEEEDIAMFSQDLDVGLIPSAEVINRSLLGEVEAMAIEGGRSGVVQHGLIGDRDAEHGAQDEGRLSRTQGKSDVKREDKAENIRSVMDGPQIDGRLFGLGEGKLVGLVMVLPVLVGELKLRASFLGQCLFSLVEFIDLPYPMGTGIVAAFVDGHFFSLFPGEEGVVAVGAVVLGLALAESFFLLKAFPADFAQELGSLFAVIVVEVGMGRLAGGAAGGLRDPRGAVPAFYGG